MHENEKNYVPRSTFVRLSILPCSLDETKIGRITTTQKNVRSNAQNENKEGAQIFWKRQETAKWTGI